MIEVSTGSYRFSHDKEPRGNGIWIFTLYDAARGRSTTYTTPRAMSYGEAKTRARREAKAVGCSHVIVEP